MAETRDVLPYPILGGEGGGGDQGATLSGSGSHLSGEANELSSSLRDFDPSRGPAAPGVLWSAWSETDADSDPSDPSVTYCTEWFIGRWPLGAEEPECRVLIGEGRSAEIIAHRVAEKLTSILNTDRIRSGAHGWRADCFRTRMSEFDVAYKKARESSQPQDWMDAALLAQQFRNVAYAVLTGEAPRQEHPRQTILKPCPWEEEHLCCYPKCNCAPDREPAPCDGSGEADETEGLSPQGDSAVTEGQAPEPSPPPPLERLPKEIVKAIHQFEDAARLMEEGVGSADDLRRTRSTLDTTILHHLSAARAERDAAESAAEANGDALSEEIDLHCEATARAIAAEDALSAARARAERAEKALEEIRVREAAEAEQIATEQAAQNIAYLRVNIAQMERFMERGEEADPIGYMQWRDRRDRFQRELDAALSPTQEP